MAVHRSWSKVRALGYGSTATVWLATSPSSPTPFAVKASAAGASSSYSLLQREQRILSSLNSPYVVSYLGFEASADFSEFNLFMEYATGGSLAEEIKAKFGKGMDDESLIRSRARDVLLGLRYLHGIGLVHCDVKSRNVLIGSEDRAMLVDFGCSKWVSDSHWDKSVRGTPLFMSPEVARGEMQGPEADIWALGCTVIEMATGRLPWPDFGDPIATLHEIAFGNCVAEIPCEISEEGKDFLDKCLKRDPKQRWTAEQLLTHPFVAADSCSSSSSVNLSNWVTPKTVLDQDIWESMTEDEDDEEDQCLQDLHDAFERIRQLAAGETNAFSDQLINWTLDESCGWVTVRSSGDGSSSSANCEEEESRNQIPASVNGFFEASMVASDCSSSRAATINSSSVEFTSTDHEHLLETEEILSQYSTSSNNSNSYFRITTATFDISSAVESENMCKNCTYEYYHDDSVIEDHFSLICFFSILFRS